MKKTYKTKYRGFNIYVDVNGVSQNVEFKKGIIYYTTVGCLFTTEDKDLQAAIENHRKFGVDFWTDDVEKKVAPVKEAPVKETEVTEKKSRKQVKE